MKLGSLFSGGGLGDFGFMAAGMDITWQCEIDEYCQKILALRYPESTKYRDIKTLKGDELERVDIITGGFPCQPFSVAGKQMGENDNRNLWPEMLRIIKYVKPKWVIGENVSNITSIYLDNVLSDLENENYSYCPIIFSAHALGAPHLRERLWILATNSNSFYSSRSIHREHGICFHKKWHSTKSFREWREWKCWFVSTLSDGYWQEDTIKDGGINDGRAYRVERLKMLGNGQVPSCTYVIGKMIMEIEAQKG